MPVFARHALMLAAAAFFTACGRGAPSSDHARAPSIRDRLAQYTSVHLAADLSSLTAKERAMLPLLVEAARIMDGIYWKETFGNRDSLLSSISDPALQRYVEVNYGPWDRLADDESFVPGVSPKPKGAQFYPHDMTTEEFETAAAESPARAAELKSLYTLVRRDASGRLVTVPFRGAYAAEVRAAAKKVREAAALAEDAGLRRYLELRATALETDNYQPSDLAWMDMKTNTLDLVIGPIETYEDGLFGYKAAHEAYVLIKDREWSQRLARYGSFLPALQRGLPVPEAYRREKPGSDSDLNAYDAVFYSGQANAGPKTIAINLPNDEEVQLKKGSRRLQLKNTMRAKFDRILVPIAEVFIDPAQQGNIAFDAFFEDVMFHEVAHGLGIKQTIDGTGTVRAALKERASALEEEKADVLGLYMVTALHSRGELGREELLDNYVTFLAGIVRSVRFGGADTHGRANISEFNFLRQRGAFNRDAASGTYRVDLDQMKSAINELGARILTLQGDGDYAGTVAFYDSTGTIGPELKQDLARLATRGIPVDVVFEQGASAGGE